MLSLKQIKIPEDPTFRVVTYSVAGANNKAMVGVVNTGSAVIGVWRIWLVNVQVAAITGILGSFELKRITGVSGHTVLTPDTLDTADTVPAGVLCFTAGTPTGEATRALAKRRFSTDEWVAGTVDQETNTLDFQNLIPAFDFGGSGLKPLVLRTGQGFALYERAATAQGTWDLEVEFTEIK